LPGIRPARLSFEQVSDRVAGLKVEIDMRIIAELSGKSAMTRAA
jgi:hypothetical protein